MNKKFIGIKIKFYKICRDQFNLFLFSQSNLSYHLLTYIAGRNFVTVLVIALLWSVCKAYKPADMFRIYSFHSISIDDVLEIQDSINDVFLNIRC